MKPYVIIQNSTSADGRIDWFKGDVGLYYQIAAELQTDATLTGTDTLLSGGDVSVDELPNDQPQEKMEGAGWLVVTDSRGRVADWDSLRKHPYWKDIIVLCSRSTPKGYIKALKGKKMNYIVEGDDRVDLARSLEMLSDEYGIKRMRLDSGGTLNGAMLRQGLVNEVILLINPYMVGGISAKSCYRAPDLESLDGVIDLKLISSRRMKGGVQQLRYQVVQE